MFQLCFLLILEKKSQRFAGYSLLFLRFHLFNFFLYLYIHLVVIHVLFFDSFLSLSYFCLNVLRFFLSLFLSLSAVKVFHSLILMPENVSSIVIIRIENGVYNCFRGAAKHPCTWNECEPLMKKQGRKHWRKKAQIIFKYAGWLTDWLAGCVQVHVLAICNVYSIFFGICIFWIIMFWMFTKNCLKCQDVETEHFNGVFSPPSVWFMNEIVTWGEMHAV